MNFKASQIYRPSQAYNLNPQQYLEKFKKPHSVISSRGNSQQDAKDKQTLQQILKKAYNDNQQSAKTKQQIVSQLELIIANWINDYATDQIAIGKNKNTRSAERKQYQNQNIVDQQDLQSKSEGRQRKIAVKQEQQQQSSQSQIVVVKHYGLKIFGSYSLKANSFDGDIDMVAIVPQYFTREKHFFGQLVQRLRKQSNITQVLPIPYTLVPLIRLTINDIQIDLLVSRISSSFLCEYPQFFESRKKMSLHQNQLKSVNGYRTSLYLRNRISKFDNFTVALKAIKMWAKNKGIYYQIFGYLGGAAFSIMLTKISQLYPNYSCLGLLDRFFFIYSSWVWTIPVKVQQDTVQQSYSDAIIAIYTPLEPHVNSAYSISKITLNITRKFLKQAAKVIQQINKGKKTWKDLFEPTKFFSQYRSFLQISVMAQNQDDFISWKGNVQSKLRKLIKYLQNQNYLGQQIEVNPFPKSFIAKHPHYKFCSKYYIGFSCQTNSQINDSWQVDLNQPVRNFVQVLQQTYSGISKAPEFINIGCSYVGKQSISEDIIKQLKFYQA